MAAKTKLFKEEKQKQMFDNSHLLQKKGRSISLADQIKPD